MLANSVQAAECMDVNKYSSGEKLQPPMAVT